MTFYLHWNKYDGAGSMEDMNSEHVWISPNDQNTRALELFSITVMPNTIN